MLSIMPPASARFYERAKAFFTRFILPSACLLCGTRTTKTLCLLCRQDLPILPYHCPQCAHILYNSNDYCGRCMHHSPPFDRSFALFPYEAPIVQFIIQLKFCANLPVARLFSELLLERITTAWYKSSPLPDLILPIPLHRQRLSERGFNQALEIAKPIAKKLKLPIDSGIKRIKPTAAQSGLSATGRKRNIKSAFKSTRDYRGQTIALIDDVVTTGSTVTECSKLLKQRGANAIHVWCVARA